MSALAVHIVTTVSSRINGVTEVQVKGKCVAVHSMKAYVGVKI
jgi:hypothetical protein